MVGTGRHRLNRLFLAISEGDNTKISKNVYVETQLRGANFGFVVTT